MDDILEELERICVRNDWWVSLVGRRVSEETAAKLLEISPDTLARWRRQGKGPGWCRIGGGGRRVSYPLVLIAKFLGTTQHNPDEPA